MAYDLATVTNSGNQLLASVVSDKSSLVIDKIEVSNTQLASSTDLKSMTSISNVVQTLSANGYQKKDNSFIISTVLDNSSVTVDYQAWVFGIWAHEADGGSPILMSVITSTSSPDTIAKGSGTPIDYNYKFITTFSNTSSLTIQMASDTYAANDTVLHNSGDETATGTKTFQEIKISNNKFPNLVQTDGQYITLDGGNSEIVPANDSKVVHTTDMRKPASDVAGIEEVNAKQDKIGYTPADDSKVVHSADTSNWQKNKVTNDDGTPFIRLNSSNQDLSATLMSLSSGFHTVYANIAVQNSPFSGRSSAKGVIDIQINTAGNNAFGEGFLIGYTNQGILMYHIWLDGSKANYTQIADDSKVAHLSGDNNFDTVPTVNNNPLLLASSLPSDLARTGQDANFTGKLQRNGKDVATTDDLTIVYAGVPSLSFDNNGNYTITASKNADIAHITDYALYYRVKGNGDFTQVALTPDKLTGTIDLSKVTTATNFESYATATNVFGESDPSATVQWSYDPAKASSTPPTLAIADDGTYTITAPATTPTAIVKYFLYYNVDGQSDSTKLDVGTKLTGNLKELIAKPDKTTTYDIQATAMNANAESGVSNSLQFTYIPIDDNIYGASWDRKSSPTLTRTDAAVGLKAGINGSQNDFDNVGPWKGMHRVTDSMNNVFVRVPKFYIRKTQTGDPDNGTATWQVSLVSHGDDWYLPKGFWDFENSKELDYIDIGAYDATGSSSKLTSVAGKTPLVNLSIAKFRSAAKANGTGYQIWDIHAWDMLQVLFIIEFATLNSQSIMEGFDSGSGSANSGAADSHKGSSGTDGSGSSAMSYRGIENLYGNVWQFCDGVNFKDNQPWVCEDATNYQSDLFASPYVRTSYTATSDNANNYIKALGFDSVHPYAQFTTDDSGSESTYYADYDWPGSGNTILETGGYWVYGAGGGLFLSGRYNSSTSAVAYAGCRLLKKALP